MVWIITGALPALSREHSVGCRVLRQRGHTHWQGPANRHADQRNGVRTGSASLGLLLAFNMKLKT